MIPGSFCLRGEIVSPPTPRIHDRAVAHVAVHISCLVSVSVYLFFGVLLMLYVVQNVCEIPVLDLGRFFRSKDDSVNDDLYSMDTRRLSEHTEYKQTDTESYQKDSSRSEDDQSVD